MHINLGIINLEMFDICYVIAGVCFGLLLSGFYISNLKKEIKSIKRQYEKKSIGADDSSLRIKTLENKIKTLETALKKASEN